MKRNHWKDTVLVIVNQRREIFPYKVKHKTVSVNKFESSVNYNIAEFNLQL